MAKIALYQHGAAHTILAIAMAQVKQRALKRKGAVAAAVKQARLLRGVLRAKGHLRNTPRLRTGLAQPQRSRNSAMAARAISPESAVGVGSVCCTLTVFKSLSRMEMATTRPNSPLRNSRPPTHWPSTANSSRASGRSQGRARA